MRARVEKEDALGWNKSLSKLGETSVGKRKQKYTQWKTPKRDLNKIPHLKSKATIPLTLGKIMQLAGQFFVLIIWMKRKVCKNNSKINSIFEIVLYTYDNNNWLFIWSYSMWVSSNDSILLIICCVNKKQVMLYHYIWLWA